MLVAILLLGIAFHCYGQPQPPDTVWTRNYGSRQVDCAYGLCQTTSGDYVLVGSTWSYPPSYWNIGLVKTDVNGSQLFASWVGASFNDYGDDIARTSDGGFIITGYTNSHLPHNYDNILVMKFDSLCQCQWYRNYGGIASSDVGNSIQQCNDNGYVIAGQGSHQGARVIKIDENGDKQWWYTYSGAGTSYGCSVKQTVDGGFIVSGISVSSPLPSDVLLIKINSNGLEEWSHTYGGADADYGIEVCQTSDGGYIVVGTTHSFGTPDYSVYLLKTDSLGTLIWSNYYNIGFCAEGHSVKITSDNGYIIAGWTFTVSNDIDVYVIKVDSVGNQQWYKTIGGLEHDSGYKIIIDTDGNYIIAGVTQSFGNGSDFYLIKIASEVDNGSSLINSSCYQGPECDSPILATPSPNPCNNQTTIEFTLSSPEFVDLSLYNLEGWKIITLLNDYKAAGTYRLQCNMSNLSSGIYFACLNINGEKAIQKVLLVK